MSSEEGLSPAVRAFIREHIRSVADLELLALLLTTPATLWTVAALDQKLRSNEQVVAQRLADFTRARLVERVEGPPAGWQYRPQDPSQVAAAAETIQEYRTRPVLVIETIFRPHEDAAQSFADAFRFRPR